MNMHHVRRGSGPPLLLLHGLGGSWRSWTPILDRLAAERTVIAPDLPGFGETPPLRGEVSIERLASAVTSFLEARGLDGVDVVGSSMGARLALELARRGVVGATVSLAPSGFWTEWQRSFLYVSTGMSIRLVRRLEPVMPRLTRSTVGRTMLFAQLSARPRRIAPDLALAEMRSCAASPSFDEMLYRLAFGSEQQGATETPGPIVIGWGRRDRVCFPDQAARALELFPGARLHWFDGCGHLSHWDAPEEAARLILANTGTTAPALRFERSYGT